MRLALLLLLALSTVSPLAAQSLAGTDSLAETESLDWRGYYPLAVGNAWEWTTDLFVAYAAFDRREIAADTLINGQRYFVLEAYTTWRDSLNGLGSTSTFSALLRYDTLRTRVVQLDPGPGEGQGQEFDFTLDLSDNLFLPEYPYEGQALFIGQDTVRYAAAKFLGGAGGGQWCYHDLGCLPDVGDGNVGSTAFTYLRVGDREYGQRRVPVSTSPVPESRARTADTVKLYPNPVEDQFVVEWSGYETGIQVAVYDLLGRSVLSEFDCGGSRCRVEASELVPGAYFARVSGRGVEVVTKQFVVVR